MLRKTLRILLRTLAGIVAFLVLYFIAVFSLSAMTVSREAESKDEVTIYIKTNGVHTDIVVPARNDVMDWSREVKYANNKSQDTSYGYLGMGWGDKGFYLQTPTWADLKASVACKAAFGLSSSAMHATYYAQMHEDATCRRIDISREQYQRLVQFITGDFRKDGAGHFMHIQTNANYGATDAFYEAKGRYSLFYTCNTWANSALKHCGQKCCVWTIFDKSIFAKYDEK